MDLWVYDDATILSGFDKKTENVEFTKTYID